MCLFDYPVFGKRATLCVLSIPVYVYAARFASGFEMLWIKNEGSYSVLYYTLERDVYFQKMVCRICISESGELIWNA